MFMPLSEKTLNILWNISTGTVIKVWNIQIKLNSWRYVFVEVYKYNNEVEELTF